MHKPNIEPYKRHIIMCCGKSCGENLPLLNYLKQTVQGMDDIRVNRAGCLGVCTEGPIMVVYPEGIWYCQLDEKRMDLIVKEHIAGGKPVESLMFHTACF
ncbi:MAG: ferredoxin [Mariprofundaceae bacterium]